MSILGSFLLLLLFDLLIVLSILGKERFGFFFLSFFKAASSLPVCFDNQLALQRIDIYDHLNSA